MTKFPNFIGTIPFTLKYVPPTFKCCPPISVAPNSFVTLVRGYLVFTLKLFISWKTWLIAKNIIIYIAVALVHDKWKDRVQAKQVKTPQKSQICERSGWINNHHCYYHALIFWFEIENKTVLLIFK